MNALRLIGLHLLLLGSNLTIAAAESQGIFSPLQYKHRATIRARIATVEAEMRI